MQSQFFKSWKKRMRWPKGDFKQERHEISEKHENLKTGTEKEEKSEPITETEEKTAVPKPAGAVRNTENETKARHPEEAARFEDTEEVYKSIHPKGDFKMCRDALFCDGTSSYVMPPEPAKGQRIRLRFRTARNNVSTVLLVADSGIYQMERALSRGVFDYYEISWKLGTEVFSYYFEIHCGDEVCYYNRTGVSDDIKPHYSFRIVPGFSTPDWAKGAVM